MVVNDLVIRVKNRTHRGDINVTNDVVTQQIIDAINDARREVIRLLPKQWLRSTSQFNTTIGVSLYDLPADCQEPLLFRYVSNNADYFLTKVESEREFYLNVFGTTISPNKPLYFYDAGVNQSTQNRQIFIFPAPDLQYTILMTYMMDPTLVDLKVSDLNTTVPLFPSYVQDALWKGAKYHFLKQFDDPNVAAAKSEYEEAKLEVEIADDRDLDSDLSWRMDVGRRMTDFRSPSTGIRLK